MTRPTITVDDLELLATTCEDEDATERRRLHRLISAYARIVAAREPERCRPRPTRLRDESGHWDSSYPPAAEYTDHTGPVTIRGAAIRDAEHDEVATSSGYYYTWRYSTTDPGLVIGARGELWGRTWEGTARLGQYAAYPGTCDRDVEIVWEERHVDDVPLADLREAERVLRDLAFPLVAQAAAG